MPADHLGILRRRSRDPHEPERNNRAHHFRKSIAAPLRFVIPMKPLSVLVFGCVALLFVLAWSAREKADLVIVGGAVVTMDGHRRVIADGAVAVRGDSIVAVGAGAEIEERYEAAKMIDARGAIVMPGLINGHAHTAMSLFRG